MVGYLCAEVVWVRVEIHNARWKREWRLTNILLKPAVICSCLCYGELSDDTSNAAGEGGSSFNLAVSSSLTLRHVVDFRAVIARALCFQWWQYEGGGINIKDI